MAKFIGGWRIGWITSVQRGAPLSLSANCGLYGNCAPDIVKGGIDLKSAGISWDAGAVTGILFANRYTFTRDPQCIDCSLVDPSIRSPLSVKF